MRVTGSVAVRHYLPGGREHGGGIGRLVGYVVDASKCNGVAHVVEDTRGPRWSPPLSLARLTTAVALLVWDRLAAPHRIHHIHVAGRGSTTRKLILTAVARTLRCRHVLHLHDYDYAADFAQRPPWLKRQVRRMFRGADCVVVLGERDRATTTQMLDVEPSRVTVLHNAVPDPGPPPNRTRDEVVILFLGRLSERKGVPELLAALAGPAMADQRWRAVLAGDGPVEEFATQADALGLADRVTMPGWLGEAETHALCAQADILVLPSRAEGLAMAVIEGMAHGLAVVTTRVGSHEEAIVDGVNGVFVPVGDPTTLAEVLARLVRDPAQRARLGRHARERYCTDFSMASYMPRLERLYAALMKPDEIPAARRQQS